MPAAFLTKKRIMSIPVSPNGKYFVRIPNIYRDRTAGGLFIDPTFNPGEHAEVTGTVASIPRRGAIPGPEVGDSIAFSYNIVYNEDVMQNNEADVFYEDEQLTPFALIFSNQKGESLVRRYLMNDKYGVYHFDPEKKIVDFKEGISFGEAESWLEKFPFRDRFSIVNNNLLHYEGEDYWMVDRELVYAYRRDNQVKFLPGYLFCSMQEKPEDIMTEGGLIGIRMVKDHCGWVKVLRSSEESVYEEGSEVYVEFRRVPEYKFWGQTGLLVREDQVKADRNLVAMVKV